MPKIEYNGENCMKCQCAGCPVQAMSQCTMDKRPAWNKMRTDMMKMMKEHGQMGTPGMSMDGGTETGMKMEQMGMEMLAPEQMIGLYCSSAIGKSSCGDLDGAKDCVCPTCRVWNENNLSQYKYCIHGDAETRG